MEVYGRNSGRNGSQSDHQTERGVTVLQESMMRMGVGSGETFPERAGVPDCVYYMRTGYCGFGGRCRYNHPRDRSAAAAAVISGGGEYPERVGEPECQFYLKTGTCKYGTSCKFHHPKHGAGFSQVPLNIYGYPVRPGEVECSYYLKTGQCKFGIMCKFHHPQLAGSIPPVTAPTFYSAVQSPTVPTPDQYGGPSNNWRVARPPLLPGSYVQGSYGPVMVSPGVVPIQSWNPYSAPISPAMSPGPGAQPTMGTGSIYGVAQLSSSAPAFAGPYHPLPTTVGPSGASPKDSIFPERPGQPECQYFKKTGDCKFGSSCRYHHPREWVVPQSNSVLSPLGLPLRLGVQPCAFYLQNGQCKFGASCKFDHPVTLSYSPSTSSLTDMPVVPYPYPYPLGSPLATVPLPSFSSSELRPEFISVPQMDFPSVGLILSHTAGAELSNTSPPLSGSGSSTRQGAEVRYSS